MTDTPQHCWKRLVVFILFFGGLCLFIPQKARAQSSGPTVDECSSQTVDSSEDVEETVCLYGDASGVTASNEVDNYNSDGYVAGVEADEELYNGSTLVYNTGDSQNSSTADDSYVFTPVINAVYELDGYYGECQDSTYSFDYSNCSWTGDMFGVSVQAQVTPSVSLTTSNPSVTNGTSVTFTASITGGFTGSITFYDGTTSIGAEAISGSTATLTTSSLAVGYHNMTAYWPGNGSQAAMTSVVLVQTVFQPGPIQLPSPGNIATIAGNGIESFAGDGGYAMAAELNIPEGVAIDSSGNVYIADYRNNRIRKINVSTGLITTVAGNGTAGFSGDGGAAISAELYQPTGVALDSSGNIYIADEENQRIREVTVSTGLIATIAGNGTFGYSGDGGQAKAASLALPGAVAVDPAGNLYIADFDNSRIRKVTASTGIITTVAGDGTGGYSGDGGQATSAEINSPWGVAVDANGNIYIADTYNNRIRKVTASTGVISTVAGNGTYGFSGDTGQAIDAKLGEPLGVVPDTNGNIYISDYGNNRIRKVDASTNIITTIAGNGSAGYSGDGGPATSAELYYPFGVALDSSGNLYIADEGNNRIRAVGSTAGTSPPDSPTGLTATAGNGQVALSWNGVSGATSYNVYEGTSPGAESTTPIITGVSGTSYTATGLTNGIVYYFTVAAVNSAGTSGYSNEANAAPANPNAAPLELGATAENAQVLLSWVEVPGAESYNIYEGTTSGGESSSPVATGITDSTFAITGLTNGTAYYFTVAAVYSGSTSAYSNEATATPSGTESSVYSFNISQYDPVGNVISYTDSANGAWNMTVGGGTGASGYDTLNRLSLATWTPVSGSVQSYCWTYDNFGNRTTEAMSNQPFVNSPGATNCQVASGATLLANNWALYTVDGTSNTGDNGKNQLTGTPIGRYQYDSAGDVAQDTQNQYLYDAEGRICAAYSMMTHFMTEYLYDADGNRVAKGSIATFSCDTTTNGFSPTSTYILSPGGQQLTEMASSNGGATWTWAHTNVWAAGQLIATYSANGGQSDLNFELTDWLGTRRVLTDYAGTVQQKCQSLPYGDGESCPPIPTEHLFTGKERDTESGNDYFGARYYASSMGRFLSPDWNSRPEPVPYASLDNPQSLNLYSYASNNPLLNIDSDGHCWAIIRWWQHACNKADGLGWVSNEQADKNAAEQRKLLIAAKVKPEDANGNPQDVDWNKASNVDVNTAFKAVTAAALKPINLPAWKDIDIDIDHIVSGHTSGGSRVGPGSQKDLFPEDWDEDKIERAVREAYKNGQKTSSIDTEGRVWMRGTGGGRTIEMIVNTTTKTIETAWPK